MKKLKFLTLAAIAAATAMVSSCSDNDVLEGVKDTGIPFSVTASTNSGGSRGSDITSLSNFQLWGFGTEQTSHFDGDNFVPKSGSTAVFVSSGNTPNWPNTDNCLFYGISDNTSTMEYGVTPGVNSTKTEIRNGAFTYTIPTSVADQKDLLVAAATGNSNDGVQLKFDHALTAAKLHLMITPEYSDYGFNYKELGGDDVVFVMKIRKVKIHNIKISGTYSFDGSNKDTNNNYKNGSWNTDDGSLGTYVIDLSDSPLLIQHKASEGKYESDLDIGGSIYFIPQKVTPWDIAGNTGVDTSVPGTENNYSYIEFEAITMAYYPADIQSYFDSNGLQGGWTQDEEGNYLYNNKLTVTKDFEVVDFYNEVFWNLTNGVAPVIETCNFTNGDPIHSFETFTKDEMYGSFYTPFKATNLVVNGNRIFKVNMEKGVRNDGQGSAVFGMGSHIST